MNRLLILSPLALAACVQHQDPCFTIRPVPCDPFVEECFCDDTGQDRNANRIVIDPTLPDPVVTPPHGGDSGGSSPDVDDDDVSDKTSDKNEDRPRKSDKSSDSNGDNSDD